MASPGRKEEPIARPFRWAAGGERGIMAATAAPAVALIKPVARLVTLKVQDAQRRVVARTMRRTDKLQVLMDYYYDMVCSAGAGAGTRGTGRFVFDGKRLRGEQTPEDLGMKSGDKIDFFGDVAEEAAADRKPVIKPGVHVTLKLKVQDTKGRMVERAVPSTQKLQVIMDAYYDSVPDVTYGMGKFLYDGRRLTGGQTPAELKMEDEDDDGILIDFFIDMMGGGGWAATAAEAEQSPVPA